MAVLSVVVTMAYSIMTRSFAQGQIALERTTTQGMIAAQISMLRDTFARHEQAVRDGTVSGGTEWRTIVNESNGYVKSVTSETQMSKALVSCDKSGVTQPFYFDPTGVNATIRQDFPSARPVLRQGSAPKYGDGMWIEGYKITPTVGARPYYDFYIKACWDAAISGERQTVVTNVRFYEIYQ